MIRAVVLFALSSLSLADDLSIGLPNYAGSGCPSGTASAVLAPNSTVLSILFDEFTAEANRTKRMERKNCNMSIPVHIPSGFSIALIKMDYRGFSEVPKGASADVDVDAFFSGLSPYGPKHHHGLKEKTHGDFYLSNKITTANQIWSPCGKDVDLKIVSSIQVRTNQDGEQTIATIDSLDIAGSLTYQIQMKTCTPPVPPPKPGSGNGNGNGPGNGNGNGNEHGPHHPHPGNWPGHGGNVPGPGKPPGNSGKGGVKDSFSPTPKPGNGKPNNLEKAVKDLLDKLL